MTDKVISRRLKDLISCHEDLSRRDLDLLKVGRQFRLGKPAKIVVGRDQRENESFPGPTVLVTGDPSGQDIQLAADITASYSDAPSGKSVAVRVTSGDKGWSVRAMKREKGELRTFMI